MRATGIAQRTRLLRRVLTAFPETAVVNIPARYNALEKRRAKNKVAKQARKRNRGH